MMNQKHWVAGAVLAMVLANTGCVSCPGKTYAKAWTNGPELELPLDCRDNVYVFMVHGVTPTYHCGLGALRDKLAERGYSKVGIGDIASCKCIAEEITRIAKCDADAKFVLLGYDLGAPVAVSLARDLTAKHIRIEALVLLDPVCAGQPEGAPVILITSGKITSATPHSNRLVVPDANHFNLPAHPTTVAAIMDLVAGIATRGYQPGGEEIIEWNYPYAPDMRPIPLGHGGHWDFLTENGIPPQSIGTRVESTKPTATTATPPLPAKPSTSAGAVMLPK